MIRPRPAPFIFLYLGRVDDQSKWRLIDRRDFARRSTKTWFPPLHEKEAGFLSTEMFYLVSLCLPFQLGKRKEKKDWGAIEWKSLTPYTAVGNVGGGI